MTGNQKEMKRVAPLKQMRLKEGRKNKKLSKLGLEGQPGFTFPAKSRPIPSKFSSTEVSSKPDGALDTALHLTTFKAISAKH